MILESSTCNLVSTVWNPESGRSSNGLPYWDWKHPLQDTSRSTMEFDCPINGTVTRLWKSTCHFRVKSGQTTRQRNKQKQQNLFLACCWGSQIVRTGHKQKRARQETFFQIDNNDNNNNAYSKHTCMISVTELTSIRSKFRSLESSNGLYWPNVNHFFALEITESSATKHGLLIS